MKFFIAVAILLLPSVRGTADEAFTRPLTVDEKFSLGVSRIQKQKDAIFSVKAFPALKSIQSIDITHEIINENNPNEYLEGIITVKIFSGEKTGRLLIFRFLFTDSEWQLKQYRTASLSQNVSFKNMIREDLSSNVPETIQACLRNSFSAEQGAAANP